MEKFQVEKLGEMVEIKFNGDDDVLVSMFYTAMVNNPHVAVILADALSSYMKNQYPDMAQEMAKARLN